MGISKRELLEDYYVDEIAEVVQEYNRIHGAEPEEKPVDAMTFFGAGGEVIG